MNKMELNSSKKDFEIIHEIGKGACGRAFKARRKQDRSIYTMKVIPVE